MDLSIYEGCGLGSVIATKSDGPASLRVLLHRGQDLAATLVFEHVVHVTMDFTDDVDLVLRAAVQKLPCAGPWPESARHLLHHHNNERELVHVVLDGPTRIEVLAGILELEQPTTSSSATSATTGE